LTIKTCGIGDSSNPQKLMPRDYHRFHWRSKSNEQAI